MFDIKSILLPTDFSNLSLSAANFATSLAKQYKAEIHLMHVIEKTPPMMYIHSINPQIESFSSYIEEDAKLGIEKIAERFKKEGVNIITALRKGLDYQEIVDYAEENKIDIIVIATHGRTGILHTLLGSVAEKVIRYSKIPVLVITPTEKEK
jgi:nucleotide-binding universal stress UspA family protein